MQDQAAALPGKRIGELDANIKSANDYATETTQRITDARARATQLAQEAATLETQAQTASGRTRRDLRTRAAGLNQQAAQATQEGDDLEGMATAAGQEAATLEASRNDVRKQAERDALGLMGQAAAKENEARGSELYAAGLSAATGLSKLDLT